MDMNPKKETVFHLTAALMLVNLMGSAIGFFVGNIKPDQKTVATYVSLFMFPPVILAGFIANTGKSKNQNLPKKLIFFRFFPSLKFFIAELTFPTNLLGKISFMKYAMEILARAEFGHYIWGESLLDTWDYTEGYLTCYLWLIGWLLIFKALGLTMVWINCWKYA